MRRMCPYNEYFGSFVRILELVSYGNTSFQEYVLFLEPSQHVVFPFERRFRSIVQRPSVESAFKSDLIARNAKRSRQLFGILRCDFAKRSRQLSGSSFIIVATVPPYSSHDTTVAPYLLRQFLRIIVDDRTEDLSIHNLPGQVPSSTVEGV